MAQEATTQTFRVPDLGEGLTEAEVVEWHITEGDDVVVDQPVVEVETAKATVEVPSPYAGRVITLHAVEGETVAVGAPLISVAPTDTSEEGVVAPSPTSEPEFSTEAEVYCEEERAGSGNVLIGYGTAAGGASSGRRRRPRAATRSTVSTPATPIESAGPTDSGESAPESRTVPLVISPLVRKLARDRGIGLRGLAGSGVGGVITRADVEGAAAPTRPAATEPEQSSTDTSYPGQRRTPLTGFRKAVSKTLSRSRSEIPEATVWVDVDATALCELRESLRTPDDAGPGLLAYIARFTVAALRDYPVLNAQLDTEREEIVEYDRINLGVAVHSERGLVVPAVMGAERMSTTRLDQEIRRVTATAREGRSTPEELSAGTFTLNNYGGFRVDGSAAIINHPQVAILGFGRIIDRPWVVGGEMCVRKITQMSFVFDHRVCDGGTASGFMRSVADAIENPASAIARL